MANSKGRSSKSYKNYYSAYNPIEQRTKRLLRHLKKQPNDESAKAALDNVSHRAPKPSIKKNGWLTEKMVKSVGFDDTDKKKAISVEHVNPKSIAWVKGIMRKSEKQHQHDLSFNSKKKKA